MSLSVIEGLSGNNVVTLLKGRCVPVNGRIAIRIDYRLSLNFGEILAFGVIESSNDRGLQMIR